MLKDSFKKLNEQMKTERSRAKQKNIVIFVSYAMIFFICCVFVHASRWSFYSADDFSHATAVGVFGGNVAELFKASVEYMVHMYKNWQGTYLSMFLQGFFSPLNGMGEPQLAVVMIFNFLLFAVSLILLVREICGLISMEKYLKVFLSFLALFSIMGFKAWREIFYWFSGAVAYSFPLSIAMLAIMLYIKNKNMITYVAACILTFLASGGSLEVAGTSCFTILIILLVKGYKKLKKKDYIFFGIAVLGALINTIAPGNFMRRDVIDSTGLHIETALTQSIQQLFSSIKYLLYQTPFLIVIVFCMMIGFHVGGEKWFHKILACKIIGMFAIMPIVTSFPVYLAYTHANGRVYLPNRCEFVYIFVVIMATIVISVLLGVLLKESKCISSQKSLIAALLFLFLIMPIFNSGYRYDNLVIYRMCNNIYKNNFSNYCHSVKDIYAGIEKNASQDVVVEMLPVPVNDFMAINSSLTADATYWTNVAIARYYGKNSVVVKEDF